MILSSITLFYEIVNSDSQESDKFYETEPSEYLENLQELSNILENCKAMDKLEFHNICKNAESEFCFLVIFIT